MSLADRLERMFRAFGIDDPVSEELRRFERRAAGLPEEEPSVDTVPKADHDLAVKLMSTEGRMNYIGEVLMEEGGSWKNRFDLLKVECERLGIDVPFKDHDSMARSYRRFMKRSRGER